MRGWSIGWILPVAIALMAGCTGATSPPGATAATVDPTTSSTAATTMPASPSTAPTSSTVSAPAPVERSVVSVLLVGDVMLGRGVASVVREDPIGLFEDVRHVVTGADVAAANLESPLTTRPHIASNPYALEAAPQAAGSLATAGFDLVGIANNHSGDAGRLSVLDTIDAVEAAGLAAVGGGSNQAAADRPWVFEREGLRVGFLAFDATRAGTPATSNDPGIATWDQERVGEVVRNARPDVDLLVVGLHGGVEYYTDTDPALAALAGLLVDWGADVVWGHGPHVVQPVSVVQGDRPAVVATSLGNFIFDQSGAGTRTGAVLEVLADEGGIVAFRLGGAEYRSGRVRFDGWELPSGDAALLGLEWWSLVRDSAPVPDSGGPVLPLGFEGGDITAVARGDVTGDGSEDLVISYRRPFEENDITRQYPDRQWADASGRSAHLGVYRPGDYRQIWVAGTVFRPVGDLVVCDGPLAMTFDSLDDPAVVATGGWVWEGFGFTTVPELPGYGEPACLDVDGDGFDDPVILDRS